MPYRYDVCAWEPRFCSTSRLSTSVRMGTGSIESTGLGTDSNSPETAMRLHMTSKRHLYNMSRSRLEPDKIGWDPLHVKRLCKHAKKENSLPFPPRQNARHRRDFPPFPLFSHAPSFSSLVVVVSCSLPSTPSPACCHPSTPYPLSALLDNSDTLLLFSATAACTGNLPPYLARETCCALSCCRQKEAKPQPPRKTSLSVTRVQYIPTLSFVAHSSPFNPSHAQPASHHPTTRTPLAYIPQGKAVLTHSSPLTQVPLNRLTALPTCSL